LSFVSLANTYNSFKEDPRRERTRLLRARFTLGVTSSSNTSLLMHNKKTLMFTLHAYTVYDTCWPRQCGAHAPGKKRRRKCQWCGWRCPSTTSNDCKCGWYPPKHMVIKSARLAGQWLTQNSSPAANVPCRVDEHGKRPLAHLACERSEGKKTQGNDEHFDDQIVLSEARAQSARSVVVGRRVWLACVAGWLHTHTYAHTRIHAHAHAQARACACE
jgi:hypothetical protein